MNEARCTRGWEKGRTRSARASGTLPASALCRLQGSLLAPPAAPTARPLRERSLLSPARVSHVQPLRPRGKRRRQRVQNAATLPPRRGRQPSRDGADRGSADCRSVSAPPTPRTHARTHARTEREREREREREKHSHTYLDHPFVSLHQVDRGALPADL